MADAAKGSPMDVATRDPATGHAWARNGDLAPWYPSIAAHSPDLVFCLRCGLGRRRDGRDGPCKGTTRIAPRDPAEGGRGG